MMRGRSYTLLGAGLLLVAGLAAQQPRRPSPPPAPAAPGAPFEAVFVQGAGIRVEGPPRTGAPYSADAVTEIVQPLPNGDSIRRENRSSIARDSQGRTRREEELNAIGPWATAGEARSRVSIHDPVAGVYWLLEPESKTAYKTPIPRPERGPGIGVAPSWSEAPALVENIEIAVLPAPGGAPGGSRRIEAFTHAVPAAKAESAGAVRVEDLGERSVEGVTAKGTRTTRTIPAGAMGNERPIEIVHERWFSPELGVDLISDRSDPRMGETKYRLANLRTAEPLPSLFEPPPDYEVKERADVLLRRPMPPIPPSPPQP